MLLYHGITTGYLHSSILKIGLEAHLTCYTTEYSQAVDHAHFMVPWDEIHIKDKEVKPIVFTIDLERIPEECRKPDPNMTRLGQSLSGKSFIPKELSYNINWQQALEITGVIKSSVNIPVTEQDITYL